jgi:tRNA(Ile)-lysidine synthase
MPAFSVETLLAAFGRWPTPARLWIAYSGGCDSHVLLHTCARIRDRLRVPLRAIHVDHGLHPQSQRWSAHCRAVCDRLQIPLSVHHLQLERCSGESLEAQARESRYRAFAEVLAEGDAIATAQHLDDQAETLLLALLRGSGVHGLAAMPARAALGRGHLLRPLLGVERAALQAYAEQHRLRWLDDPTNAVLAFDRNRLRHQVLPVLRERWPAAARTIARSAGHCAEAATLLDAVADDALPRLEGTHSGSLSVTRLVRLEPARARLMLRRWLTARGFGLPNSARLNRILTDVLCARRDASPLVAWDGCEVRRYRDDLFALAPLPHTPPSGLRWSSDSVLELPAGLGRLEWVGEPQPTTVNVCFSKPGQHCLQPGRPRRPVRKLFQEAGIPSWLRPLVPRLTGVDGSLLLVPGVCGCGLPEDAVRWIGHPWQGLGWFDH